jgi:23S rRNA-/tRNA-specific pseudouridylate synthase
MHICRKQVNTIFTAMVAAVATHHRPFLAFTHRLSPGVHRRRLHTIAIQHLNLSRSTHLMSSTRRLPSGIYSTRRNQSVEMATHYKISVTSCNETYIKVSLSATDDASDKIQITEKINDDCDSEEKLQKTGPTSVPESVLQYERQLRKIKASDRASKTNVTVEDHLLTLHVDKDVIVANKPSGILCVPGVNKHRSLLDLVYEVYGRDEIQHSKQDCADNQAHQSPLPRDSMIVHRLDMDTSGIVVFARTKLGMSKLHEAFRTRTGTKKLYEALLVGWLDINAWISAANKNDIHQSKDLHDGIKNGTRLGGGEINLPLQRDHKHPPFMRVSTPESEVEAQQAVRDLNHAGWKKLVAKRSKPSVTRFQVLSHEYWMGHHVTRVALIPITGRTHQLRVHCAALGHPILGDPAYGYCGEAHPNGGFSDEAIGQMSPTCAGIELRRNVEKSVRESGRTMCLHARQLVFNHPATGEAVSFDAPPLF